MLAELGGGAPKLTGIPLRTLLAASRTSAVSVTLLMPSESNCGLLTRRSIRLGTGPPVPDGAVTVIEVDPATLGLVACARTVSAPAVGPAVYFTVTCPLLSVVPLVGLRDAPLVLVDSVNVIVSPGTRLPLTSVTAAVKFEVPPVFTVLGEALSCTRAAGPGTKKISICVRKPMASAVTTAIPAVV